MAEATADGFDVETYAGYVAEWSERGLYLPLSSYGYLLVPTTNPYLARDRFAKALLVALDHGFVEAKLASRPPKTEKLWPLKRLGVNVTLLRPITADEIAGRLDDGSAWEASAADWIFVEATPGGLAFARQVREPKPFMDELVQGGVVYPWVRRNLRDALAVLAHPEGEEKWIFADAVNDLPNSAFASVGWMLRSDEEEHALSALIEAVEVVVHWSRETGVENNDWDWTAPAYPHVAEAATRLLRLIDEADSRPSPPPPGDVATAFRLVISKEREPFQAGNWAAQWLVWGRGDESDETWRALKALAEHHVTADRTTPDVVEYFERALEEFVRET